MNYLGETIHRYSLTFAALASLREKSSFVTFVPSWWKLSLVLWLRLCRAVVNISSQQTQKNLSSQPSGSLAVDGRK